MRVTLFRRGRIFWLRARARDGTRIRRSLDTENRKLAEDLRSDFEWKLRRGETATTEKRVSIPAFLEEYRLHSLAHKRPKSHATDMARLEAFLATVDAKDVSEVETSEITRYLSGKVLADSIGPTTVLRIREALHAFFAHAKRLSYVRENPVSAVPRPRVPDRDPRFLSLDQVEELLEAVKADRIAPLVATIVYAGLRREESCWVTWADLDLRATPPMLRVCAKTVAGASWMPKTKRNRTVPISSKLAALLAGLHRNGTPWVFSSPDGFRWDPDNLSHRFAKLMRAGRLPWNLLDLRHTFGSQLARKGISLLKIAKLMGNSPEIARRHYIHLLPEEMAADVEF